jgi:hypothetical protein
VRITQPWSNGSKRAETSFATSSESHQGFDPAAFIDAVMPAALLAFGQTVAGAGMTAVDNKGARKAVA